MPGPKLNESPVLRTRASGRARAVEPTGASARSVARYVRVSPYKVREVLDLIRGHDVERALDILRFSERDAATMVAKVLASAVANAEHTLQVVSDELFVSACFADEGPTLKRWRPRARGRATRIRKRTCHVTVIVSRLPESSLARRRSARPAAVAERRRRRTGQDEGGGGASRRRGAAAESPTTTSEPPAADTDVTTADTTAADTTAADTTAADDVPTEGPSGPQSDTDEGPPSGGSDASGEQPEGKE